MVRRRLTPLDLLIMGPGTFGVTIDLLFFGFSE